MPNPLDRDNFRHNPRSMRYEDLSKCSELFPDLVGSDRTMLDETYRAISLGRNLNLPYCMGFQYHYWITEAVDSWSAAFNKGLCL